MEKKVIGIESVTVEDELAGEILYDAIGGSLHGAALAIREFAAKTDAASTGANLMVYVFWEDTNVVLSARVDVTRDLEFYSDTEMEKFFVDSINCSIARDFCDFSRRALGQLDYSWDNHVDVMCDSVDKKRDTYCAMISLLDGKHEKIQFPAIHPKMARKLYHEGLLDFTPDQFLKLMPREEISKCLTAYQQYVKDNVSTRSSLSFESFYRRDYLVRFLAEPERQAGEKRQLDPLKTIYVIDFL